MFDIHMLSAEKLTGKDSFLLARKYTKELNRETKINVQLF